MQYESEVNLSNKKLDSRDSGDESEQHEREAFYNRTLEANLLSSDRFFNTPSHHFSIKDVSSDSRIPPLPFRPRKFSSPLLTFPSFRVEDAGELKEDVGSSLVDSGFSSAFIDHVTSQKLCPKYHGEGLCELGPTCPMIHETKQANFPSTSFNPTAPEFHPISHYKLESSLSTPCVWNGSACSWDGGTAVAEKNFLVKDITSLAHQATVWKYSSDDFHRKLITSSSFDLTSSREGRKNTNKAEMSRKLNPVKYKTEPCTTFHTIGSCPYGEKCFFYHKVEERSLVKTKLKTRLCKSWNASGRCPYGERCDFAHGCDELNVKFKTRMCKVFLTTGRCPYGEQCTFAHNFDERRRDISTVYKFKTELCQLWLRGSCTYGPVCHFAHGAHELQPNADLSL